MTTTTTILKERVAGRPALRTAQPATSCPGCTLGLITRVIAEVLEDMGIDGKAIGVSDIGCNSMIVRMLDIDSVGSLHGRSTCVATGVKRVHPDALVFNVQGDGGLAAIGMGNWMNTVMRAEKITTIFVNNAGYGMTGGQSAPTTLTGMITTTTPYGRDPNFQGFPAHIAELAASMPGTAYAARASVDSPVNLTRAKRAVKMAFEKQLNNVGYSIVEFVSACPTDWGLRPVPALKFVGEKMVPEYALGEFKNVDHIDYTVPEIIGTLSIRS